MILKNTVQKEATIAGKEFINMHVQWIIQHMYYAYDLFTRFSFGIYS